MNREFCKTCNHMHFIHLRDFLDKVREILTCFMCNTDTGKGRDV